MRAARVPVSSSGGTGSEGVTRSRVGGADAVWASRRTPSETCKQHNITACYWARSDDNAAERFRRGPVSGCHEQRHSCTVQPSEALSNANHPLARAPARSASNIVDCV